MAAPSAFRFGGAARRRSRLRFWEMMDRIDAMEKKLVGHELHRLTSAYLEACRFRV
jgi:hypothetical protein